MAYYLTTSPEPKNAVPGKFHVSPKTHTPGSPVKERGHRYYSANLSRLVNRDPIGMRGGLNAYAFVLNSPVHSIDALGLATIAVPKSGDTPSASCKNYGSGATSCDFSPKEGKIEWTDWFRSGCGLSCIKEHEGVHASHFKYCCERAGKCAKLGVISPQKCWEKYTDWHGPYQLWSQCEANKKEKTCLEEAIKNDGDKCCNCLKDKLGVLDGALKGCDTITPPGDPAKTCPFNEDGSLKGEEKSVEQTSNAFAPM